MTLPRRRHGLFALAGLLFSGCVPQRNTLPDAAPVEIENTAGDILAVGEPRPVFSTGGRSVGRTKTSTPAPPGLRTEVTAQAAAGSTSRAAPVEARPTTTAYRHGGGWELNVSTPPDPDAAPTDDETGSLHAEAAGLDAGQVPGGLFLKHLGELQDLLDRAGTNGELGNYERIRKADLEKKLIALFFLRDERDHTEFRDLLESLTGSTSSVLALEILKAAFFQEVGLLKQRDRILKELRHGAGGTSRSFGIKRWTLSSTPHDRRRQRNAVTEAEKPVFQPGQNIEISGQFEHFANTPVSAFGGLSKKYRRSFSAALSLLSLQGELIARSPILLAGTATELTGDPERDVRFWGRFRLPGNLPRGPYMLEIVAVDLEGKNVVAEHREIVLRR